MLLHEKERQASEQRSEQPYVYILHICKLYVSQCMLQYTVHICKSMLQYVL